jgi:hypothetical protein
MADFNGVLLCRVDPPTSLPYIFCAIFLSFSAISNALSEKKIQNLDFSQESGFFQPSI